MPMPPRPQFLLNQGVPPRKLAGIDDEEQPEEQPEDPPAEPQKDEIEKRAKKAAMAAVYSVPVPVVPQDTRDLNEVIAPAMEAIDEEMDSRRDIADDLRDKQHEQTIVAAKLQNERDLKSMELDAMLKRLRMEQDERRGIKRFGPNKYGI